MNPTHFATPAKFRAWLERNHDQVTELWVGFYKKASGKGGMVYAQALDEALCFGWIDGLVRSVDAERYMQRFTPRKRDSIWSNINVGHVKRLTAAGRMQPSGLAAFAARTKERTGVYSFEAREATKLPPAFEKKFRAAKAAWTFFMAQPPGYRRLAFYRVMFPKQEATRLRWLDRLIQASAEGKRLDAMAPGGKRAP